jgi:hypothetical protein
VTEHREAHRGAQSFAGARFERRARSDGIEEARGDVHRTKGMRVSRVGRPREREITEAKLTNVAQALKRAAVDDARFFVRRGDAAVNGISYAHREITWY